MRSIETFYRKESPSESPIRGKAPIGLHDSFLFFYLVICADEILVMVGAPLLCLVVLSYYIAFVARRVGF